MQQASTQPAVDLGRLAPTLGKTCSGYLGNYRREFEDAVRAGQRGVATASRHAHALDGLLSALYCASDAATRATGREPSGRVALVAVGGYARGTLGLHSDVDVVFLCDDPNDPYVGALAEGLLYPLWDLGVDIGHAVRGVEGTLRLAREDIRTATTLIDMRRVAGDRQIIEDLQEGAQTEVLEPHLGEFLDALESDTEGRHGRFGGSLYLLEPEVKQGRGGLRDLDVADWAARARWGALEIEDYVRAGALLERELKELEDAREMLWRVRNLLHLRAGRQQDRLTFADQEDIAQDLGFVDGITLGVEQFMQAYYRHARIVALTAERMVARARPRQSRYPVAVRKLGDGTLIIGDHIRLEEPSRLLNDPALAFRFYRQAVRYGKRPDTSARDAISRISFDKEWCRRLRNSEEANQLFVWLFKHLADGPFRLGSTLLELHEVGLVVAMIPEFAPLVGRVHHDMYHVYTTDIHAVVAHDRLRELARGDTGSLRMASRLAVEAPRNLPIMLATFLHSIGKARGHNIGEEGASVAKGIATRLGLRPADVEHVGWLVREHWTLYRWATQRDIYDSAAVAELANMIQSPERLRDLYLVTVANVSTINPDAMTSWKARALEDLFLSVSNQIETQGSQAPPEDRVVEVKLQAVVGFVGDGGQEELQAFLDEMPDRYFLANAVDAVRRHARIARDRGDGLATVCIGPGPSEDLDEVVVLTKDQPGLLADVTAALAANKLQVITAEIYTRTREGGDEAFDIFLVRSQGNPEQYPILTAAVSEDLEERLAERISAKDLIKRNSTIPPWAVRRGPTVRTQVSVDNDASSRYTVVDVFTKDRVGLLHQIAYTLHKKGVSIALSKINTEGQRVADVFYVSDESGEKIRDSERLKRLQAALHDRIQAFHARAEAE